MKIGILIRKENSSLENKYYVNAIETFGGEVVFIRDDLNVDKINYLLDGVSGILLTGGDSVGPIDFYLIEYALKNRIRLLGICQGMQSMALYGSNDKLVEIGNLSHKEREGYVHCVYLKDSKLKTIFGTDKIQVNSHHIQTVKNSYYFSITGYSDDNLIEAVESDNDVFQIGVQWHPERMIDYDFYSRKIFENFIC